jgi:hypothetical protein
MDFDTTSFMSAGVGFGMAWGVQYMGNLFMKIRKQDKDDSHAERCYKPSEEWKTYCTQKFESITDTLTGLKVANEIMKSQLSRLELEINRMGK